MKKIIILISLVFVSSSIFAMTLVPTLNYKVNNIATAVFCGIELEENFNNLCLNLTYNMGYDNNIKKAYNSLETEAGLNFNWGNISINQTIGREYKTDIILRFNSLI